ncbi:MAG TPA: shikimate kinase [Candidatus Ornithomonoglobus intestinigallinarum]|uniref:Shikimate kinase n=1 Tax=Candidatus Ornithomonoglobus intestinigallinarum TaxID=2840894 RepID=A0A9D1KR80_9FIRM|nr:shikimate kinase [Candidatus Ornithomonoglobus intestinigallinarum]
MNIVLTGFMATGKTKIGKSLAELSGFSLVDTDALVEAAAGMTINEIFSEYGEERFRELETEASKKAAELDRAVISTGGGTVLKKENIDALRKNGVIVNLAPGFEVIRARAAAAASTRPLMNGQSMDDIEKRFNERKPFYDNCDIKIKVTNEKTPSEHAEEILEAVNEFLKNNKR